MATWTPRTDVVTAQTIAVGGFYESPVISNQGFSRTEITARWSGRAATLLITRDVNGTIGDVPDYYYPVAMQRIEGTSLLGATVDVDASEFRVRIINNGDDTGPLSLSYRQAGADAVSNVNTELPDPVAMADGLPNPTSPIVGAVPLLFNGATYDRARNGQQDPDKSAAVTLPRDLIVGAAASLAAVNTDLLTGTVNGWYDARLFHSAAIQIIGLVGITAGAVTFEQTNDPTNTVGIVWPVEEDGVATPTPILTAQTIAANSTRMFRGAVTAAYVRVRVSTAFAGGNVRAIAAMSELPYSRMVQSVQQNSASALQMQLGAALPPGTNTIGAINKPLPVSVTDVASGTITTTTTSATITPSVGGSYQAAINVTAATGTMVVAIEESDDSGTAGSWYQVWQSNPITTTGIVRSPVLQLKGNRVRYVQTLSGTTPSFTRSINRSSAANDTTVFGGGLPNSNSTIAAGGTAQTVAVAKVGRKYLEIQNTSTGDLWIRWGANAAVNAGYRLTAGQAWSNPPQWCPDGAISIFGATTGQTFAFGEA